MIRITSILINGFAVFYLMVKCNFKLLEAVIILTPIVIINFVNGLYRAKKNQQTELTIVKVKHERYGFTFKTFYGSEQKKHANQFVKAMKKRGKTAIIV